MTKKMLMLAAVQATIGAFNMNNMKLLQEMGVEVHVAANFTDESVWTKERTAQFESDLKEMGITSHQIDFSRSALNLGGHRAAYRQLLELLQREHFDFIHTHTPIASALGRLVAKKVKWQDAGDSTPRRTKVIYTAHGFHFYDGAPKANWLLYYPVEKSLAKYTDVLITINREDFARANQKFPAKRIVYVPGVGVDTKKFAPVPESERDELCAGLRAELNIPEGNRIVLSVGELNENKNHAAVVNALAGMENVTYLVAGKGPLAGELENLAKQQGTDLRLLGFRTDVDRLYKAADLYVLPSFREGLNVSLMEAAACGAKCIASNIRGNRDILPESCLFPPADTPAIRKLVENMENVEPAGDMEQFSLETVRSAMQKIYENIL